MTKFYRQLLPLNLTYNYSSISSLFSIIYNIYNNRKSRQTVHVSVDWCDLLVSFIGISTFILLNFNFNFQSHLSFKFSFNFNFDFNLNTNTNLNFNSASTSISKNCGCSLIFSHWTGRLQSNIIYVSHLPLMWWRSTSLLVEHLKDKDLYSMNI